MLGASPSDDQRPTATDWEAFRHHRQAYRDRAQIAELEALWRAGPDELDDVLSEDLPEQDPGPDDDDEPQRWVFIL